MPPPDLRSRRRLGMLQALQLTSGFPLTIGIILLLGSGFALVVALASGDTMSIPGGEVVMPGWLRVAMLVIFGAAFAVGGTITFVAAKAVARPGSLLFRLTHRW